MPATPSRPSWILATLVLASPSAALASSPLGSEEPTRTAVQERLYGTSEELRLGIGSMPLDPFQKGWSLSLSYTHHFSDLWAWEILQVTGALLTSTSLRDELIGTFARRPEEFAAPRFMATTGLELSPLYGKQVLFNRSTLHAGLLLGLYGGVLFGDRPTLGETFEDIRPALGGGLGFRVWASESWSIRVDSRLYAAFRTAVRAEEEAEVETVALFTLSLSLGFGGSPR